MNEAESLAPAIAAAEAAFAARRQHTARAAAAILPGPLHEAFAIGLRPGGLRQVCLGDLALLAGWNHPLAGWLEAWLAGENPEPPTMNRAEAQIISALVRVGWERAFAAATDCGRRAFDDCSREILLPPEVACGWLALGFTTMVQMRADAEPGTVVSSAVPADGLGWWLRLYGFALTELGLTREAALALPLAQLVALRVFRDREDLGLAFASANYTEREEAALAARSAGLRPGADPEATAAAVTQGTA